MKDDSYNQTNRNIVIAVEVLIPPVKASSSTPEIDKYTHNVCQFSTGATVQIILYFSLQNDQSTKHNIMLGVISQEYHI